MANKTIQDAVTNLRQAAPLIQARYTLGINGAEWQTPAASEQAEQNYGSGVQRAIADGSRRTGILAVTNQAWRDAAIRKGASVIGDRIIQSLDKYQRNFGPILTAMNTASAALMPRTTSARANVTNRLLPIIEAAQIAAGKTPT